jgi:hypothetical protein
MPPTAIRQNMKIRPSLPEAMGEKAKLTVQTEACPDCRIDGDEDGPS